MKPSKRAQQIAEKCFSEFQRLCRGIPRDEYWQAAEELQASLEGVLMERSEEEQP